VAPGCGELVAPKAPTIATAAMRLTNSLLAFMKSSHDDDSALNRQRKHTRPLLNREGVTPGGTIVHFERTNRSQEKI
jgi:hypothetical protein